MSSRWGGGRGALPRRRVALWATLVALLTAAVSSLVWIAYGAVGEWRRSTELLLDQRSEEALTLLTVALNRDMKGVHHSVLAPFNDATLDFDRGFELEDLFAQAFARFPYPESFFVWRDDRDSGPRTLVFSRLERSPAWAAGHDARGAFPVVSMADPPAALPVIERLRQIGGGRHRFGAFDTTIAGMPYQVVVHLLYHTAGTRSLFGAVGFTVNLDWVRQHYFQEIVDQISRIGQVEGSMQLAVVDPQGRPVAGTRPGTAPGDVLHQRTFPLSFLDAELIQGAPDERSLSAPWTLSVSAAGDPTLAVASRVSTRTSGLILLAAAVAAMGILLTVRALKASADLAAMQSEFVASATHELKTPLSLFQLVAETLARGRYTSEESIRSYGRMLSEQVHLLERLIDNLLAYGSLGHVARCYHFETLSLPELVEAALERFDARLVATGLEVTVDVPSGLPAVRGDRVSLLQVLDNVIDNAIKYSPEGKSLSIRASADNARVLVMIRDQGPGIPVDQRERVFDKFYRGPGVTVGGSGLGLAIARRVVEDHGGRISIGGDGSGGTEVEIVLPAQRG